ncbi:tyrosine-type recombinase/integrase (plasmid) [Enterocloster clostridioformis]
MQSYHEQQDAINHKKLKMMLKGLPPYCGDFMRGIEPHTSSRTRIGYAYDLEVFFRFLKRRNPAYRDIEIKEIPLTDLDMVKAVDIEEYMEYLKYPDIDSGAENSDDDNITVNKERGIMRKLSSLRSFYNYFFRREQIKTNPPALVDMPKISDKEILRLDIDEVACLLDEVESGGSLSGRQKSFHRLNMCRDLAIMTLMLGTGIRVSECVGLDITDIDFKNAGIRIHRKGGNEVTVYFGPEVEDALRDYLDQRQQVTAADGSEAALFLSLRKSRITVRSVEVLVKKYSQLVTPLKKITPHKLRSTYGTTLYQETGDIYLVADVLGHKDVNTTRKHYAALQEDRRRSARTAVKLREK